MPPTAMLPLRTVATKSAGLGKIALPPAKGGLVDLVGITPETTRIVCELLQDNHETHHVFFNDKGFHNHIVHQLLAQYDLGAPVSVLKEAYKRESHYQRPRLDVKPKVLADLSDENKWGEYLGKEAYYHSFLEHFQKQMEAIGWQETVNKTLFSKTELADDMLVRTFGGLLHPFIHLGYGVEFSLPVIVAEALAQAAVHDNSVAPLTLGFEKAAALYKDSTKTMSTLLDEIRNDPVLSDASEWDTLRKMQGIVKKAGKELVSYTRQFNVPIDQIDVKLAESTNAAAQICGGAIRPEKHIKFDFFLMHAHNSSMALSALCLQSWISPETKARLIEWKGRHDLTLYTAHRTPKLYFDEIRNYVPKDNKSTNPWMSVISRSISYPDDGHCIKFVRSLAYGEKLCRKFLGRPGFEMEGDMWVKLAHMCIDSCETKGEGSDATSTRWIRSTGFDEAWEGVGPRKKLLSASL